MDFRSDIEIAQSVKLKPIRRLPRLWIFRRMPLNCMAIPNAR